MHPFRLCTAPNPATGVLRFRIPRVDKKGMRVFPEKIRDKRRRTRYNLHGSPAVIPVRFRHPVGPEPARQNMTMNESPTASCSPVIRAALLAGLAWTLTLYGLFSWNSHTEITLTTRIASAQTRSFFREFLMTRFWNALHGGVYVPVTDRTRPNPYLQDDPARDLVTTTGMRLTKLNPAYMTRQIAEIADQDGGVSFHLTSLEPIRPENAPDPWEAEALRLLRSGGRTEYYETVGSGTANPRFRYMSPLFIEAPCLRCHERYGDREGRMHGGISISIPALPLIRSQQQRIRTMLLTYLGIWLVGLAGLAITTLLLCRHEKERQRTIGRLEESMRQVQKLSGLLPICSSCKNIRDDQGYWNEVEQYMSRHADIRFTHGICPDCAKKLYPDLDLENGPAP